MNLDLMQWNINGYYSKLPHLQQYIDEKTLKIICLQETWVKTENDIYLKGYQQPHALRDRRERRGGGVCIFVVEGLLYDIIPLFGELEATAIQIHLPNMKISICSLYIPPDFPGRSLLKDLMISLPTSHVQHPTSFKLGFRIL